MLLKAVPTANVLVVIVIMLGLLSTQSNTSIIKLSEYTVK